MYRIITTRIDFDFDRNEVDRFVSREAVFGVNELLIEESFYAEKNKLDNRILYRYDANENCCEEIHYDSIDGLIERHSYDLNPDGLVLKSITEYNNGSKYIKDYSISDLGLAELVIITDEDGNFAGKETYVFDSEGRIIDQIELDASGNEILREVNTYDSNGNLVEVIIYQDGELQSHHKNEYDDKNRVYRSTVQSSDINEPGISEYFYDQNDLVVKCETKSVTGAITTDSFEYDENGDLLKSETRIDGKLVFFNACTYKNGKLISEELFEVTSYRGSSVHYKLIHEYVEVNAKGEQKTA